MKSSYSSAVLLFGLSLVQVLVSQLHTNKPGEDVILHCSNMSDTAVLTAWYKQVNGSMPLVIMSMHGSGPDYVTYNGLDKSRMNMSSDRSTISLSITRLDSSDSGLYLCGQYLNLHFIFVNASSLKVQGDDEVHEKTEGEGAGTINFLPLSFFLLGGVIVVLLLVILILLLKIRRHNLRKTPGTAAQGQPLHDQDQDPEELNYAALRFHQKKQRSKRAAKKQMRKVEPNVVYAATR